MNAVVADEQRDPQASLLHEGVGAREIFWRRVQQRTHAVLEHVGVDAVLGVELEHLAHLLGERHAAYEIGDALASGQGGIEVGRRRSRAPV